MGDRRNDHRDRAQRVAPADDLPTARYHARHVPRHQPRHYPKILLLIAVFGVLGVQTTSFAALLAAAALAIGAAWSGLLANFAAGLFLLFLRPFKVGDSIEAGTVTGTVREIGLFTTVIDTADNVRVSVGNDKLFADPIWNYSANPYRRVEITAPIAYGIDPLEVIRRLSGRVRPETASSRR